VQVRDRRNAKPRRGNQRSHCAGESRVRAIAAVKDPIVMIATSIPDDPS
jgi:hypothetical protein